MRPDELEKRIRERLDALGPAPRAELLHVLMLPDLERVGAIQSYWGNPGTRTFAELLISRVPGNGINVECGDRSSTP